ncbi:hypothetical protein [Planctomyces sp. SH-PL62]|uniref:hypothetical protein n=1 Tax=Planctomyces sp. SH-PL62 TaxID=1636152 RepID=UPI0012E7AB9E|nr:hypothetical protein [Planctomyces sp. SH-PL62]
MANNPPTTLERLLDAIVDQLSPEGARAVLDLYAPDDVKARIDALVEKIMQGGLEPAEQDEYDGLMQIVHAISMIQDRLEAKHAGPPRAPTRPRRRPTSRASTSARLPASPGPAAPPHPPPRRSGSHARRPGRQHATGPRSLRDGPSRSNCGPSRSRRVTLEAFAETPQRIKT